MAASEDRPKCNGCGSSYRLGESLPYLLPCLHSVCQSCQGGVSNIKCLDCGETCSLEKRTLPRDVVTEREIFVSTLQRSSSELVCTNRNDGFQAVSWCQKCEAFLCEDCQASHEEMKATKSHQVVSINDLSSRFGLFNKSPYCSDHVDHPFTFYDNSCRLPICAMCVLTKHQQCSRDDLDEKSSLHLSSLEEKQKALLIRQERLSEKQSAQKQHRYRLTERQDQLDGYITNTFNELHSVLRQREQEIRIQLGHCFRLLGEANKEREQKIDEESARNQTTADFISKCLTLTDSVDLLNMKEVIDARSTACLESQIPQILSKQADVIFDREEFRTLMKVLASFGGFFTKYSGAETYINVTSDKEVIVKNTEIVFTVDRINTKLVHIDERGYLVNDKSPDESETECSIVYSGAISREPLSDHDLQFWQMEVNLELFQQVENLLLFETGLADLDLAEQYVSLLGQHFTFLIFSGPCVQHNSICVKSRKHGQNTKCLKAILQNSPAEKVELSFGFLFNPEKGSFSFLDLGNEDVLEVMQDENLGNQRRYWPVCGAFNKEACRVELKLISGSDLVIKSATRRLIQHIVHNSLN